MSFAQAVKKYRENRGLSQTEFAERVGVCRHTVSLWENGWVVPQQRAVRRKLRRMLGREVREILNRLKVR